MMPASAITDVIQFLVRESVAVAALFAMFLIYRMDRQRGEKDLKSEIATFIDFGATRATHDVKMGALLERLTSAIEKIEARLQDEYVCPISQVSTEILRDVTVHGRRQATKRQLADAILKTLREKELVPGDPDASS